ncbi:hypothetical protein SEA_FAUST_210 [Streptomyces phage Faust]|uniref:Uncharacterized protein n=1 Tax=Streptomyces phage Faust TaxID=2767565 RepID=A0A7G9UZ27_9CAUD|nr:hypothetical protein PP456_gp077 [Streptomyces phage Faust]QNN99282.1 hypothetical protein SEA_FAUST_210 [Streptomyces phage Faust]
MITVDTVVTVADNKTLRVEMHYDEEDPAAVCFIFENEDETYVEWIFARDLLKEALEEERSGAGDVLFQVIGEQMKMGLISPESKGFVLFDKELIEEFVEMIYEEVPEGEDSYEWPEYFILEEWSV